MWNDERVLAYIALPDIWTPLHGARLKYSISLGKSAPKDLWYILAIEGKWLQSLRNSLDWFSAQTQGLGPSKTGAPLVFDFNYSIRHGGAHFSRWIKKACRHATLQHRLISMWKEWHHNFLSLCSQFGLQLVFPWTTSGVTSREKLVKHVSCVPGFSLRGLHARYMLSRDIIGLTTAGLFLEGALAVKLV